MKPEDRMQVVQQQSLLDGIRRTVRAHARHSIRRHERARMRSVDL
jgi:hypothetical protein